jgi:hypothetical protein
MWNYSVEICAEVKGEVSLASSGITLVVPCSSEVKGSQNLLWLLTSVLCYVYLTTARPSTIFRVLWHHPESRPENLQINCVILLYYIACYIILYCLPEMLA